MENLELQNQPIDLSTRIRTIYDNIDKYTGKRGDKDEAIDIVNSQLLFSEDAVFAVGGNNSFEIRIKKVISKDGQLEGKFNLGLHDNIDNSVRGLIMEYMDFLEIDYQVNLNVQDIEELIQQISNAIKGFTTIANTNYKIDLGDEGLVVMAGWEDIYLDSEEKKTYIKGALLMFEDDSEYIIRVSKQDDIYILHGRDGSLVRLFLQNARLVIESDFVYTAKLPKYIQALDTYLFDTYMQKFNITKGLYKKSEGITQKIIKETVKGTKKDLFSLFFTWGTGGKNDVEQPSPKETKKTIVKNENIWGDTISGSNSTDSDEVLLVADQKLVDIINKSLSHIEKTKQSIMLTQSGLSNKNLKSINGDEIKQKIKELDRIKESMQERNIYEIYKYYNKYFSQDKDNLIYLKELLKKEIDIYTVGFTPYIICGNGKIDYPDNSKEIPVDMGYSSDGINIQANTGPSRRVLYNTRLQSKITADVKSNEIRRYSRDNEYIIFANTKSMSSGCVYDIHNISSKETRKVFIDRKEKSRFLYRASYDLVGDKLLVIGDNLIRIGSLGGDKKSENVFAINFDKYTISAEGRFFLNYSSESLDIYDLSDSRILQRLSFDVLLGEAAEVIYVYARKGQVKIIYKQNEYLKYACYRERDLVLIGDTAKVRNIYDMTNLENINLFTIIPKEELFFNENGKYAIFVKDNMVYILKFTNHGVKLFITETIELNHVFRVKFSPDETEAILRDGNIIYKLDLKLIEDLQTDDRAEEKRKKEEENLRIKRKEEILVWRKQLLNVLTEVHEKKEDEDKLLVKAEAEAKAKAEVFWSPGSERKRIDSFVKKHKSS